MSKQMQLLVEVPIACFRQSRAREYAETYPVPPPSTVYGMLLSLVGEMDRYKHCGVKLAIAMLSQPAKSTVIRTFRRFKKKEIADPTNARPDYQELLTDIRFLLCVDSELENEQTTLTDRLQSAFNYPEAIARFGGLCLGESRDLVNSIKPIKNLDGVEDFQACQWLCQDENGLLTLPYWVDHVGSQGTRWKRYNLQQPSKVYEPPIISWTEIRTT